MSKSRKIFHAQSATLKAAGESLLLAVRGDPTARNEAAIRAACLLLVTKGRPAASTPAEVNRLMPKGEWFRSARELRLATGGERAVIRRLAAGGVIPLPALGKWTPDFWTGLVASGAIWPSNRSQQWFIKNGHIQLVEALCGDVPFKRSWAKTAHGVAFWGLWAAKMGADNPEGVGVLAGMLAGGRRVERAGEVWLGIAWRESNAALLEKHLIPYIVVGKPGRGTILVSPFWGALLADEMPSVIGEWFRLWSGRKGMCPLLPWGFLAYAWGKTPGKARWMVPWALDRSLMADLGIGVEPKKVRRLAFERLGMRGVSQGVRAAWLRGLAARGVTVDDFPVGKVPLDFEGHLCHDLGNEGKEG